MRRWHRHHRWKLVALMKQPGGATILMHCRLCELTRKEFVPGSTDDVLRLVEERETAT